MLLMAERVAGQPAPGGHVGRRAGIEGDDPDDLARPHPVEPALELEHELAAAEVAGIPFFVDLGKGFRHRGELLAAASPSFA